MLFYMLSCSKVRFSDQLIYVFFSKENLMGKPLGTYLHFADGTHCKPVGTGYGA